MYYEYWNLKKPPFDNVPDTTMYTACHASMENSIAETLFAIEEGEDCISVIVGDVGLGKTMSIRIIIDSLDKNRYKIALVTNPSTTFVQMLREIIGQVTGKPCEERKKDNLLEIFNRLLFETVDEGKKILIFIDEANVVSAAKLENLRLLTNMQDDHRNLFTMILVGQNELGKRLEHPKRSNLFQRIGTYCRIEKIPSEKSVRNYAETRLIRAGATKKIFAEDAFPRIWEYSEHGVPRLINKICKLSLKAGETNELSEINGKIIQQVGERFQKVTRLAVPKRKPRKREGEEITTGHIKEDVIPKRIPGTQEKREIEPIMQKEENLKIPAIIKESEHKAEPVIVSEDKTKTTLSVERNTDMIIESANVEKEASETPSAFKDKECKAVEISHNRIPKAELATEEDDMEELKIGDRRFWINFPSRLIQQAKYSDHKQCMKLAGTIAAQTLKKNPQLAKSLSADPVPVWSEIKSFVFNKFAQKIKR